MTATEAGLRETLFGARPAAEVIIAYTGDTPAGFALFFPNYSTFLGKPGLYLEDLFVLPEYRGQGIGLALMTHLARIAVERGCGRFEWSVLDWNEPAIGFYRGLGAKPDGRLVDRAHHRRRAHEARVRLRRVERRAATAGLTGCTTSALTSAARSRWQSPPLPCRTTRTRHPAA